MVCNRDSFRADDCVQLWIVGKSILLGRMGELDREYIFGNAQQLHPPVNSSGIISTIQSKPIHRDAKIYLPLQMPQHQEAFLLIGRIIHQCLSECRVYSPQLLPSNTKSRICCRDWYSPYLNLLVWWYDASLLFSLAAFGTSASWKALHP